MGRRTDLTHPRSPNPLPVWLIGNALPDAALIDALMLLAHVLTWDGEIL
jgi:hypothetical protein